MKKNIKSIGVLVCICAVMSLLLAVTNHFADPIIQERKNQAANAALLELFPDAKGFEAVELASYPTLPKSVVEAHRVTGGLGYVIKLNFKAYAEGMELIAGVKADGTITKVKCLATKDDRKAEAMAYGDNFTGKNIDTYNEVDTISGSTYTTEGYKNGVKDALQAAAILGGADVDTRSPEEILADNLAAALPEGQGKFTALFLTEMVEGKIYAADNGQGYVYVLGEEFVAVKADGTSANQAAADAVAAIKASTLTEVAFDDAELKEYVRSVQKTATGNYVIDIDGRGYAYFDDNHGYGEQRFVPIHIRVSLTPDGKIIDCLTVSHEESENFGDKCGTEAYYSQFDGKTADTYTEVDAISGATQTTRGYMAAIERCFKVVEILEGGAK